uniref:Radical S-adenosyl methionine domain containing 1 n=1 Tax=Strix occidentalis caurina TaxID=311401 RepID=A0A8D0KVC8_STROC
MGHVWGCPGAHMWGVLQGSPREVGAPMGHAPGAPGAGGECWGACVGLGLCLPPQSGVPPPVPTGAPCPQWPYCRKRCSYCNFNKYVVPAVDEAAMRACLVREARTLLRLSQVQRWVCEGVWGGHGAPQCLSTASPPSALQCHLCLLRRGHPQPGQPPHHCGGAGGRGGGCPPPRRRRGHAGGEPQLRRHTAPRRLQGSWCQPPLRRRPGERGSPPSRPPQPPVPPAATALPLQSLDDAELRLLGREHTAAEARGAVEVARGLFPGRTSIDLLFGLPGQSRGAWARGLEAALGLCDHHVSLYQLTLERGTALAAQVWGGALPAPSQDLLADMYQTARAALVAAGFRHYEVSNFARKVGCPPCHAPLPVPSHPPPSRLSPPRHPMQRSSPRAPSAPTTSRTGGLSSTSAWGRVSWGDEGGWRGGMHGCVCPLNSVVMPPPRCCRGAWAVCAAG